MNKRVSVAAAAIVVYCGQKKNKTTQINHKEAQNMDT